MWAIPNTNSSIVGRATTNAKGCTHRHRHRPRHPLSFLCQMASCKTLLVAAAMTLVATAALLPVTTSKKTFTVGDDAGWDIGVDYKAWARGKKFKVGDILLFKPNNARQDVVLVDEQSFKARVTPNNAQVLSTGGPVAAKPTQKGRFFFICDAEGACESGMKLAINVH